jgi:hypothetical protein
VVANCRQLTSSVWVSNRVHARTTPSFRGERRAMRSPARKYVLPGIDVHRPPSHTRATRDRLAGDLET